MSDPTNLIVHFASQLGSRCGDLPDFERLRIAVTNDEWLALERKGDVHEPIVAMEICGIKLVRLK